MILKVLGVGQPFCFPVDISAINYRVRNRALFEGIRESFGRTNGNPNGTHGCDADATPCQIINSSSLFLRQNPLGMRWHDAVADDLLRDLSYTLSGTSTGFTLL
jgi:hypothetical protein